MGALFHIFRGIDDVLTPTKADCGKKQIKVMLCLPFMFDIYNPSVSKLGNSQIHVKGKPGTTKFAR